MHAIEYMIERSLPLLLTATGSQQLKTAPEGIASFGVRQRKQDRDSSYFHILECVLLLLHLIRVTEIVLGRLIPACDRDLPFLLERTQRSGRPNGPVPIDLAATLATGAMARDEVVWTEATLNPLTPESRYVAQFLRKLQQTSHDAIRMLPTVLEKRNVLLGLLRERLTDVTNELAKQVRRRAHLQSHRFPGRGHARLRSSQRSVALAMRLNRYLTDAKATELNPSGQLTQEVRISDRRLYEFWCFAEFTQRLIETGRADVVQQSIIRARTDKPVFAFGDGALVYYEHRGRFFRRSDGHHVRLPGSDEDIRRGPEWTILRGMTPQESVIIDCKYYRKWKVEMLDPIFRYCGIRGPGLGVGICSVQPYPQDAKRRRDLVDQRYDRRPIQNSDADVIWVYLNPSRGDRVINQAVLDRLIADIWS